MTKLRILTIGHSYVVAANRAEIDYLARLPDVEVTVVAPDFFHGDLRPIRLEPSPGAPYRLVGIPANWTRHMHAFFYRNINQVLNNGKFDLIYAWEEPYILAGYQLARMATKAGIPYVFRTAQNLSKTYPPPFSLFESYCSTRAGGWIATGTLIAKTMETRGYSPSRMEIIPHGVDERVFRPDAEARMQVRQELGLDQIVVGFVGRLVAEKGLDVLMQALTMIKPGWQLLVVGNGPYQEKLEAWAAANKLSGRLRCVFAHHDEVPRYLRAMDLLVAPSQTTSRWREQLGRMILEAFACGVPVIGSDSGEIPFVIGEAGMVVAAGDSAAWAAAINGLLCSNIRRQAMAAAGLERCHRFYSAEHVANRYFDFFSRLVAAHAASQFAGASTLSHGLQSR